MQLENKKREVYIHKMVKIKLMNVLIMLIPPVFKRFWIGNFYEFLKIKNIWYIHRI